MLFNEILLRRKNKVNPKFTVWYVDNIDKVIMLCKNINSLGYTLSKDLIEVLRRACDDELTTFYNELIDCLKEYTGADKTWEAFYPNFPAQVENMSDWELFINAVVHYLSNGKLVHDYEKDLRLPLFESPELTVIDIGTDDDLKEIMNNLISSKTSLSDTDKKDMIWLIENFGVDNLPDEIPYKENVAIICKLIMDHASDVFWYSALHKYLKTATDILRFCVYLSGGDVSLATHSKTKSFPRRYRKLILRLLDTAGSIEEDMKRYTQNWIILGELLHPGEYKNQYPKAYEAFEKLRSNKKIWMFNGKVQDLLDKNDICGALILLKNRPGEFARRLDYLLRNFSCNDYIINEFEKVADKISVPVLLQVREHFIWRNEDNDIRVFFPKGQLTKCYTVENNLDSISKDSCGRICNICTNAIIDRFESKEYLGKVYIDDSIKGYCVPQSQRSASKSMRNITRGSRFKIKDDSNFIRLGIHWMNELIKYSNDGDGHETRTDIDLSCNFLDKNFSYLDHISFTNLRNGYSTHSGDFVDAPRSAGGAAEFIDIKIDEALKYGVKYAAVQIYGYTNTKFCDLDDMLFNWQEGNQEELGEIFEPSRLQQSINLRFDSMCGIPVIFDLENREVIWCDLALTTRTSFLRCVEGNVKGLSATAMGIVQSRKPQMDSLAMMNAIARGTIVENRDEADTIFDVNIEKPIIKIEKYVEIQNEKGEVIGQRIDIEEKEKECRIITPYMTDVWQGEML